MSAKLQTYTDENTNIKNMWNFSVYLLKETEEKKQRLSEDKKSEYFIIICKQKNLSLSWNLFLTSLYLLWGNLLLPIFGNLFKADQTALFIKVTLFFENLMKYVNRRHKFIYC